MSNQQILKFKNENTFTKFLLPVNRKYFDEWVLPRKIRKIHFHIQNNVLIKVEKEVLLYLIEVLII